MQTEERPLSLVVNDVGTAGLSYPTKLDLSSTAKMPISSFLNNSHVNQPDLKMTVNKSTTNYHDGHTHANFDNQMEKGLSSTDIYDNSKDSTQRLEKESFKYGVFDDTTSSVSHGTERTENIHSEGSSLLDLTTQSSSLCTGQNDADLHIEASIHMEENSDLRKDKSNNSTNYTTIRSVNPRIDRIMHAGDLPLQFNFFDFNATPVLFPERNTIAQTGNTPLRSNFSDFGVGQSVSANIKANEIFANTGKIPLRCDECNFVTAYSGDLRRHKQNHAGEKPYKCEYCDFGTTHSGVLNRHRRKHTGEKPFKCDLCEFRTSQSGHLKKHKLIHTGEKPYKCEICEFSAADSGNLTRHRRLHTGVRPYKCDTCDMSFNESAGLKRHKMLHSGEKPFKCDVCDFSTRHPGVIKKHNMIHTGEISRGYQET